MIQTVQATVRVPSWILLAIRGYLFYLTVASRIIRIDCDRAVDRAARFFVAHIKVELSDVALQE